jgi:hypothetical protein
MSCAGAAACQAHHADQVADLVCGVRTDTAIGTYQADSPLRAGDGPTATVTNAAVVINGGTTSATVVGSTSFSRIVIAVDGVQGYYVVALPSPVGSADLRVTMCQALARTSLDLQVAIGTATSIGAYQAAPVSILEVGTGELQVSVSWDTESDVDLHVLDPDGDEVFYEQTAVASGGELDLDSNASCDIDHVNNENITWTVAPRGKYIVRLDYYDACGVAATKYTVTMQRRGHAPELFMGEFTGDGDLGGLGAGIDITTFSGP